MNKTLLNSFIALVLAGAAIIIAQIWFDFMTWDIFIKLLMTVGILGLVIGFLLVVQSDFGNKKQLKDDHYID